MAGLEDLTTDQLLHHAKTIQPMADMMGRLSRDPKTKTALQRLIHDVEPNLHMPDLENEDRLNTALDSRDKELAVLKQRLDDQDLRAKIEQDRKQVADKYGVPFDEIEKKMVAEGLSSHDVAARLYLAENSPAAPTSGGAYRNQRFDLPGKSKNDDDGWGVAQGDPAALEENARRIMYEGMGLRA